MNMGQGLILWQGLSFNKSSEVMGIKNQSTVLRPYSSAAEYYFNRGIGLTIRKGKIESTVFGSMRKLDGNSSGYHRTIS